MDELSQSHPQNNLLPHRDEYPLNSTLMSLPAQSESDFTVNSVIEFYDALSKNYRFISSDWNQTVLWQSKALDTIIRNLQGEPPLNVHDCTCGIGTQAIGLAMRGYTVIGTDISTKAIKLASEYAKTFKLSEPPMFGVLDLLTPQEKTNKKFDVVISCDNAIAHFLNDQELTKAVNTMVNRLKPGGLLLISLRDYDRLRNEKPRVTKPVVSRTGDIRHIVFQVWDWAEDNESYTAQMFILHGNVNWTVDYLTTNLRALQRTKLEFIIHSCALTKIQWHMPEESGYHQPILTAVKPT